MIVAQSRVERLIAQGERRKGLSVRELNWSNQAIGHLVAMIDEDRVSWPDGGLVRKWAEIAIEESQVEGVVAYIVGAVDLEVNP